VEARQLSNARCLRDASRHAHTIDTIQTTIDIASAVFDRIPRAALPATVTARRRRAGTTLT